MLRKLIIQGRRRQGKFSQFFSCGFLGKCIFASMHIGVGSGHICRKHRKLPLFLISGHGTQNALGMRRLPSFCLNRACFPHLKRNFVLFQILYMYISVYIIIFGICGIQSRYVYFVTGCFHIHAVEFARVVVDLEVSRTQNTWKPKKHQKAVFVFPSVQISGTCLPPFCARSHWIPRTQRRGQRRQRPGFPWFSTFFPWNCWNMFEACICQGEKKSVWTVDMRMWSQPRDFDSCT